VGASEAEFSARLQSGKLDGQAAQLNRQLNDYAPDYADAASAAKRTPSHMAVKVGVEGISKGVDVLVSTTGVLVAGFGKVTVLTPETRLEEGAEGASKYVTWTGRTLGQETEAFHTTWTGEIVPLR